MTIIAIAGTPTYCKLRDYDSLFLTIYQETIYDFFSWVGYKDTESDKLLLIQRFY